MKLVIDASVTLKWSLKNEADEQNVVEAIGLLNAISTGTHTMIQLPHWLAEVAAVLVRRQSNDIQLALTSLRSLGGSVAFGTYELYLRAAELSVRLNHHLFDTLYHALALERRATLVTADERYYRIAASEGAIARLADFSSS